MKGVPTVRRAAQSTIGRCVRSRRETGEWSQTARGRVRLVQVVAKNHHCESIAPVRAGSLELRPVVVAQIERFQDVSLRSSSATFAPVRAVNQCRERLASVADEFHTGVARTVAAHPAFRFQLWQMSAHPRSYKSPPHPMDGPTDVLPPMPRHLQAWPVCLRFARTRRLPCGRNQTETNPGWAPCSPRSPVCRWQQWQPNSIRTESLRSERRDSLVATGMAQRH